MQESIFLIYYIFLTAGVVFGLLRLKRYDSAMRIVVLWLCVIAVAELITYILLKTGQHTTKYLVFHISAVLELILISAYFLKLFCPPRLFTRYLLLICILCTTAGLLNVRYLQSWDQLNTNMLMLESFCIITLSLYAIYRTLKNDLVLHLFRDAHFWIWVLWLVLWSATFFFWAFIRILYRSDWAYVGLVMNLQALINLVVYAGLSGILLLYTKKNYGFEHS
ncbi:MAG TPA: hypothetical protein VL092_00350 [Chitinophagaceae bacterium]|nr:hypothetical protein [Chitinophagaceae bacterium]